MDTLFYKILLLFIGLGFLFLQSREFKSSRVHLVAHHQWRYFSNWLGTVPAADWLSPSVYPLRLLRIKWQTLVALSEQELQQLGQILSKRKQQLLVIFPVFTQPPVPTLATWHRLKALPIYYCELSAEETEESLQSWKQAERVENLQNMQYFLETLKTEFPSMQYFVWGAFANPSTDKETIWNMLLVQFQKYWQGYVVIIKNPTPDNFQALVRTKFPIAIHLHSQTESMQAWLEDFLFLLKGIQQLPLAYLSQQEQHVEVLAADKLLARLFWRNPRWQGIGLMTENSKLQEGIYAWHWQKDWETGIILINKSAQKQTISTNTFFPSFFYQELYYEDPDSATFKIATQTSQAFNKVVLPPQSIAFLSSTALPFIGENLWIDRFEILTPSHQKIVFQFQLLQDSSQLVFRLLDWEGKEIYHWQKKALKAGFYEMHYQTQALSESHYLCSISLEGKNFIYDFDFFPHLKINS